MTPQQAVAYLGVATSLLVGLALLLLRERFKRMSDATDQIPALVERVKATADSADRIPSRDWFVKVDREVERIPDQAYFDAIRMHMAKSEDETRRLGILEYRAEEAKRGQDRDHERLGKLEAEISFHRERMNMLDRRQDRRGGDHEGDRESRGT